MDSSQGVGQQNFTQQKIFIKAIMKRLPGLLTPFNAAIVQYNTNASLVYAFNTSFDLNSFNLAVDRLMNRGHLARIDKALQLTADYVFTSELSGSREGVHKIAILLTYKRFTRPHNFSLQDASELLQQKGVKIFVVAVGNDLDENELLEIAEKKDGLIQVPAYSSLSLSVDILKEKICDATGKLQ